MNSLSPIQQPSSFTQARHIINSDGFGLRGLNKGLTSTLGRHGVFNMIYFGFYFNVKDAIPTNPVICQSKSMITLRPPVLFGFLGQMQPKPSGRLRFALVFVTLTTPYFLLTSGYMICTCPSHLASGELQVFDSMISEPGCHGGGGSRNQRRACKISLANTSPVCSS